jgi:quinol monooxygenase YgiN
MERHILKLNLNDARRSAVVAILAELVEPTRVRPGCLDCCLCQEVRGRGRVCFGMTWIDSASLERFMRSPAYRHILNAMDLADEPPAVAFETVGAIRGMEYVAEVLDGREEVLHGPD